MRSLENQSDLKRMPIKVTIREDILSEAKALKLNASKAAEAGIYQAIKATREQQWLENNQEAIEGYNEEIEHRGLLLEPLWLNGSD